MPKLDPEPNMKVQSNLWYLDNGANNHMTERRTKFKDLDESVKGQVRFGDGSTVKIEGKRDYCFQVQKW